MKFSLIIDDNEESLVIHSKKKNSFTDEIEKMVDNYNSILIGKNIFGYLENDIIPINLSDVTRFYIENSKTLVKVDQKTYQTHLRLYQLEECLNDNFIKINQSCIINKRKILKFNTSWSGTLKVEMINGDTDYVSRRQLKVVKERMGL